MTLRVEGIRAASDLEWDAFCSACDYATYFHSRQWAEVWGDYSRGKLKPTPEIVSFSDGAKALLPVSQQKSRLGLKKSYISSPAGTFGGWLADVRCTETHARLLAALMAERYPRLCWRMNPYAPWGEEGMPATLTDDHTHVLDLSPGFSSVFKGWSKGHGSAAKKARREGVVVRQADNLRDWKDYFLAYKDSLRRWGDRASSSYQWRLFERIAQCGSQDVRLWLGLYEERVVCGCLCFYTNQHVVYWHGASLEKFFHLRPVHLVLYEAINHACENDYHWFDFNPSGGHDGVAAFKKGFGAKPRKCPVYQG